MVLFLGSTFVISCSDDFNEILLDKQKLEVQENNDFDKYVYHYDDFIIDPDKINDKHTKSILNSTHWVVTENNEVFLFDTDQEATDFSEKLALSNTQKGRVSQSIAFLANIPGPFGSSSPRWINFNNVTNANIPSPFDGNIVLYDIPGGGPNVITFGMRFYNFPNLNSLIQATSGRGGGVDRRTSSFEFRQL
ncbi:hypothetical protein [uncultured Aquimarina sp.]|uniref:hypothetical protein n=1 Tax=uncultured Aquimarina sp. TaxID=575652 RepID=UPI00262313B7|nr:hypothetical protein [uncultured Aquimarina sp.]